MRRFIFALFFAVFVVGVGAYYGVCDEGTPQEVRTVSSESEGAVKNVGNKICPVMGAPIKEGVAVKYEYEGKEYNFCCFGCIEAFKKDPQKYISIVEEELSS